MILNGDLLDATRHESQSRPGGVARPVHPGSDEAVHTLNHALALAEPDGYMRVFVDEGAPMADGGLLRAAAVRGSARLYGCLPLPLQHYGVALAHLSPMPRVLWSSAWYCENATPPSIAPQGTFHCFGCERAHTRHRVTCVNDNLSAIADWRAR